MNIRQVDMAELIGMAPYRLNKIEMSKAKPTMREVIAILKVLHGQNAKFLTLLCLLNDIEPEDGCGWAIGGLLYLDDDMTDSWLELGCTLRLRKINGRTQICALNEQKCKESGMVSEVDESMEKYANSEHSPA